MSAFPDLGDALAEIAFLRQVIEGAVIGDRIIANQFASADKETILHWAHRQATGNMAHLTAMLAQSREDFPFEGRASLPVKENP